MKLKLRILPLLLAAMFSSCTPERNEQMSKNAFSEYEIVNRSQIIWPTLLEQKEDYKINELKKKFFEQNLECMYKKFENYDNFVSNYTLCDVLFAILVNIIILQKK